MPNRLLRLASPGVTLPALRANRDSSTAKILTQSKHSGRSGSLERATQIYNEYPCSSILNCPRRAPGGVAFFRHSALWNE
jgi:hypothetical protein